MEDDKALYILRDMTGSDNIRKLSGLTESVPKEEFMSAIHENDAKESVPKSEFMSETEIHKKGVNESVPKSEFMSETEIHEKGVNESVRLRDLRHFIDLMRGVKSEPCEYYYHVMHGGISVSANLRVCSVLQNPKAVYIVAGVDAKDTSDVYGGYVYEIFVDDSLYNIRDVENEMDHTSKIWKITIPKKKGEQTQRISGNLIFYREEKICKPTLWQPK
uniref:Uncharacterized protein n=1 Tax=Tanacetum cinerariifolium TaxID=118510 RepID=A0A699IHS6_TANCI|nr:hypothetical protein [Tanacetum cinerariifolium]